MNNGNLSKVGHWRPKPESDASVQNPKSKTRHWCLRYKIVYTGVQNPKSDATVEKQKPDTSVQNLKSDPSDQNPISDSN